MKLGYFLLSVFLPCALLLSAPAYVQSHILDVQKGGYISLSEMIEHLNDARVVFVGELHDEPGHHQAQLQVIQALQNRGKPIAIGLEMVRKKDQETLDRWLAGELPKEDFRRFFEENWGMWEQYEEILEYARREKIPMIGLNIPREITQQVAREGFGSLSPGQKQQAPGVTCNIDETYRDYIRRSLGGHVHDHANFEHFCEAQMVWDTGMAHNLLEYLNHYQDTTVVVLAGSGHAWKYGIPTQIERQAAIAYRVLLPEIPGRLEEENVTVEEADYLLIGLNQGPMH